MLLNCCVSVLVYSPTLSFVVWFVTITLILAVLPWWYALIITVWKDCTDDDFREGPHGVCEVTIGWWCRCQRAEQRECNFISPVMKRSQWEWCVFRMFGILDFGDMQGFTASTSQPSPWFTHVHPCCLIKLWMAYHLMVQNRNVYLTTHSAKKEPIT